MIKITKKERLQQAAKDKAIAKIRRQNVQGSKWNELMYFLLSIRLVNDTTDNEKELIIKEYCERSDLPFEEFDQKMLELYSS